MAIRNGACVVVVDDEQRENEGDLICAAQFATPEAINFMATEARGLICLAMEGDRLDELDLPLMVDRNTDANQTAFTVSIDAGIEHGVTTGISADDRARTIQVALNPSTRPADLRRPGHIFRSPFDRVPDVLKDIPARVMWQLLIGCPMSLRTSRPG